MEKIKRLRWLAIAALFCFFSGCSQDDDGYNDSEMFTRAEGEMMRNGEGGDEGSSKKKHINWVNWEDHEIIDPVDILPLTEIQLLSNVPDAINPTLFGEYDNRTLSVSIGNYAGNAILYICSVQGNHLMGSATIEVANTEGIDFSLADYPTGKNYQIYVILDNAAYVGNFEL